MENDTPLCRIHVSDLKLLYQYLQASINIASFCPECKFGATRGEVLSPHLPTCTLGIAIRNAKLEVDSNRYK
jgi:hypothetical protein